MRSGRAELPFCFLRNPTRLAALFAAFAAFALPPIAAVSSVSAVAQDSAQKQTVTAAPGAPFTAEKLSSLLPATVYFQGKTAPLQTRNAGGTTFAGGAIVWVALVDSSGYASSIQQKFQFYLVTECPLRVGDTKLAPGAYGGGFLGDRFILMDLGAHTIAQGPTRLDTALARPRPLQILPQSESAVRLFLGRRWVTLQAGGDPKPGD